MFVRTYRESSYRTCRAYLLCGSALLVLTVSTAAAYAQVTLPELTVRAAKKTPAKPRVAPHRIVASPAPAAAPLVQPISAAEAKNNAFNQARSNLYTTIGTTSDTISHAAIQALPQGTNQPVEKVLLQAPGVSQDSAASGFVHVRNDHANLQFRINGVMLPDGVTGFGSVLDTDLIGTMCAGHRRVAGRVRAAHGRPRRHHHPGRRLQQLGQRQHVWRQPGNVRTELRIRRHIRQHVPRDECAPSSAKPAPSVSTTDCFPGVQYFFTGRYLQTTEGIENPTSSLNAIHDFSQQEKGFGYMSTFIDPTTRLSLITGSAINSFQIPNIPGQPVGMNGNPPVTNVNGITDFNSSMLNENQVEQTHYGVLALQKSAPGFDGQISYFTRYNNLHFTPDPVGDLLLNGIASDISRQSYANGIQADGSYAITPSHTLRAGFTVSAEQACGRQYVAGRAVHDLRRHRQRRPNGDH